VPVACCVRERDGEWSCLWMLAGRLVPPGRGFHQLSTSGVSPVWLNPGQLAKQYERPAASLAGIPTDAGADVWQSTHLSARGVSEGGVCQ
jgi:hypothetical protein